MAYVDPKANLVAYFKTVGPLVALMANRWSPEEAPEDHGFPRGNYQLVSYSEPVLVSGGGGGFAVARVQLKVWGQADREGYRQANACWQALRECLHGFRGWMGQMFVQMAHVENLQDAGEAPADGRAKGNSCASLDVILKFNQGVPAFRGVNA